MSAYVCKKFLSFYKFPLTYNPEICTKPSVCKSDSHFSSFFIIPRLDGKFIPITYIVLQIAALGSGTHVLESID